jgi:hypothetical protein
MLPVSLDCPFLIVPSVFSNVYLTTSYVGLCQLTVHSSLTVQCYARQWNILKNRTTALSV